MKLKKLTFKEATSENPLDWSEMRKIKGGLCTTPMPYSLWCVCHDESKTEFNITITNENQIAAEIKAHCYPNTGACVNSKPEPPVTQ